MLRNSRKSPRPRAMAHQEPTRVPRKPLVDRGNAFDGTVIQDASLLGSNNNEQTSNRCLSYLLSSFIDDIFFVTLYRGDGRC